MGWPSGADSAFLSTPCPSLVSSQEIFGPLDGRVLEWNDASSTAIGLMVTSKKEVGQPNAVHVALDFANARCQPPFWMGMNPVTLDRTT